jgi:putative MATE family efflux protein
MKTDLLISGNIYKSLIVYAIPIVLGNSIQQLYNFFDMIIVGRCIGIEALAACGATGPIFFFVFGFIFASTHGFTIVTAQHFGRKNLNEVRKSFAVSTLLSVSIAVMVTLGILPCSYAILAFLHTPLELISLAHDYMFITILGTLPLILYNLLSCTMRALGDSKTPLYYLIVSSLINLGLDLVFILVFNLGIKGAALATVTAWSVSDLLCACHLFYKYPYLRLSKRDFTCTLYDLKQHLNIGIPMGLQLCIISVCTLILQNGINRLGTDAVAAFATAIIVDQIFSQIYISLGAAISVYTAQNYGAKNMLRIERGVKASMIINIIITLIVAACIVLFSAALIDFFLEGHNSVIIKLAQETLYFYVFFYIFFGMIMIFKNTLQGMGLAKYPLFSSIIELVIRVSLIEVLLANFGYLGVCSIMPLGWLTGFLIMSCAYLYERKRRLAPLL